MMSRKVIVAKLHEEVHTPGSGVFGKTLPPNNKTFKKIELSYVPGEGIYINVVNQHGLKEEIIVPSANIAYALLGPNQE